MACVRCRSAHVCAHVCLIHVHPAGLPVALQIPKYIRIILISLRNTRDASRATEMSTAYNPWGLWQSPVISSHIGTDREDSTERVQPGFNCSSPFPVRPATVELSSGVIVSSCAQRVPCVRPPAGPERDSPSASTRMQPVFSPAPPIIHPIREFPNNRKPSEHCSSSIQTPVSAAQQQSRGHTLRDDEYGQMQ